MDQRSSAELAHGQLVQIRRTAGQGFWPRMLAQSTAQVLSPHQAWPLAHPARPEQQCCCPLAVTVALQHKPFVTLESSKALEFATLEAKAVLLSAGATFFQYVVRLCCRLQGMETCAQV